MSDEREGAGSADDTGTDADGSGGIDTAVVTRPLRPTGKRSRRGAAGTADAAETSGDAETSESSADTAKKSSGTAKKKTKKAVGGTTPNPIMFVIGYLKQVVGELRKVIWPNRKQMITYTTVVLVFLVFMVALISGVDLGFAKIVMLIFGS